jgi:hypothetical protein
MTRSAKIALGVATVWPFVWFAIFIAGAIAMMFTLSMNKGAEPPPALFFSIIGAHVLTMLLIFALTIFFVVYLFKTDRVPQDKKALWAVVIFFGNVFAFPVFWYLYIWRDEASTVAAG